MVKPPMCGERMTMPRAHYAPTQWRYWAVCSRPKIWEHKDPIATKNIAISLVNLVHIERPIVS